jgi:hypothetical protein
LSFNDGRNDFFHHDLSWDLISKFNNLFNNIFHNFYFFHNLFYGYNFLHDSFNRFLNFHVHILDNFNFNRFFNCNSHLLFDWYLSKNFFFNHFLHNNLNNLRNFYNFFNNSWNNNNFFDNFLNFNNFWDLNHFFYDFFDFDFDFFNPFNSSWHLNDSLNCSLHNLYILNVVNDWFLNFNEFSFMDDLVTPSFYFNHLWHFDSFNDNLVNDFWHLYDDFFSYWNFNSSINYFLYFLHKWNNNIIHSFNLSNFNNFHKFFNYFLHFHYSWNFNHLFHHLLNYLRHLDNLLHKIIHNYNLFNNSFNLLYYIVDGNSSLIDYLNFRNSDNFLDNFFNFHNLGYLNNLLNHFLNIGRHLDYFFNHLFHWDYFIPIHNNFPRFSYHVIYWFFHSYNLSINYNLLNYFFNFDNLGHLYNSLNKFLHDSRHFNNFLSYAWYFYNFLLSVVNNLHNFNRNMNNFFNFLHSWNFNNFFDDLFNWNNLRNLNHFLNNFLNNLFYFNHLWDNSKHLQDIININNIHNFLINHGDNSLIKFENSSSSQPYLFQLLKKSFDQNSQVEFYFSGFRRTISKGILNSNGLRNELDNFNNSVQSIDINNIDELLLEEFNQS